MSLAPHRTIRTVGGRAHAGRAHADRCCGWGSDLPNLRMGSGSRDLAFYRGRATGLLCGDGGRIRWVCEGKEGREGCEGKLGVACVCVWFFGGGQLRCADDGDGSVFLRQVSGDPDGRLDETLRPGAGISTISPRWKGGWRLGGLAEDWGSTAAFAHCSPRDLARREGRTREYLQ